MKTALILAAAKISTSSDMKSTVRQQILVKNLTLKLRFGFGFFCGQKIPDKYSGN